MVGKHNALSGHTASGRSGERVVSRGGKNTNFWQFV